MTDRLQDLLVYIPAAILLLLLVAAFVFAGMGYSVQVIPPVTPAVVELVF
jgi:hypothetical protein